MRGATVIARPIHAHAHAHLHTSHTHMHTHAHAHTQLYLGYYSREEDAAAACDAAAWHVRGRYVVLVQTTVVSPSAVNVQHCCAMRQHGTCAGGALLVWVVLACVDIFCISQCR